MSASAAPYTEINVEGRAAIWAVVGPLIALKLWTVGLLFVYAPTREAIFLALATGWAQAVIVLVLVVGPALAWLRLLRVRARREQLRRSEWMLDEPVEDDVFDPSVQWPR